MVELLRDDFEITKIHRHVYEPAFVFLPPGDVVHPMSFKEYLLGFLIGNIDDTYFR